VLFVCRKLGLATPEKNWDLGHPRKNWDLGHPNKKIGTWDTPIKSVCVVVCRKLGLEDTPIFVLLFVNDYKTCK